MSEPNQTPIGAPPGWAEAMQGKGDNSKRAAASKRIMLVLSLTFFGMFLWLYVLYNLGHSKPKSEIPTANSAVPLGNMPLQGAPMPEGGFAGGPTSVASPFGIPRGAAPAGYAQQGVETAPYQPTSAFAAQPYPAMPIQSAQYAAPTTFGQPIPAVPAPRGGVTMTAPRDFRHSIGISGGAVPASTPGQRQRMVVSR
jgi:hypothetical protein